MQRLACVLMLVLSSTVAASATELVSNGNFSGGDTTVCGGGPGGTCPGWTVTQAPNGVSSFLFNDDNKAVVIPPGVGFATFGASGGEDDELSQVLNTIPGQSYTLSFDLAATQPTVDNEFHVVFGSQTVFSAVTGDLTTTLSPVTLTVTATGTSTPLDFFGRNTPATTTLAEISVMDTSPIVGVPEPASWAMLLLGFVGLAVVFRQHRRRVSVA